MVQRLHGGNWPAFPAVCLGKYAKFETSVIGGATPYGNALL